MPIVYTWKIVILRQHCSSTVSGTCTSFYLNQKSPMLRLVYKWLHNWWWNEAEICLVWSPALLLTGIFHSQKKKKKKKTGIFKISLAWKYSFWYILIITSRVAIPNCLFCFHFVCSCACACVYMHACMLVCVWVCVHACVRACMHACGWQHFNFCVNTLISIKIAYPEVKQG